MKMSEIRALVIDDDVFKTSDIKKALNMNRIINIVNTDNQEDGFKIIYDSIGNNESINLIVTDMHYPLKKGIEADTEAGFKLIERLKKENINIPVIICSSINYHCGEALGTVWYNKIRDLDEDFMNVLERLK